MADFVDEETKILKQKKQRWGRLGFWRLSVFVLGCVVLALVGAGGGFYAAIAQSLPSLEAHGEYNPAQTSKIFDDASPPHLLADLHGTENREVVSGDQIAQDMRDAMVAIEDERFYSHSGVDPLGILRALWTDIRHRSVVQGGSTITQQFIKNAYVTGKRTLDRKIKEAALAYQLEQKWSKQKILNEYLNTIYFGEGAYGVEAAAKNYFNVSAKQLTTAQAALLAAIPKNPSAYDPRRDRDAALKRRNLILNKMYQQGYLTSAELEKALSTPIELAPRRSGDTTKQPYWVEFIREQLTAKYGANTVLKGGLRVYTSIDLNKQQMAEQAIANIMDQEGDPEASLVSIDLHTGRVVAMVGGPDFKTQQFNIATQGHRQPGSAFKPFVLVTALKDGLSPQTTYDSSSTTIELPGPDWKVSSTDMGHITLTEATARSVNGVYARLIMDLGAAKVADTARQMGIETKVDSNPAIALGGLATGVNPLEMAVAYGTLGSGGERLSGSVVFDPNHAQYPVTIVRVEDAQGHILDENRLVRTRVLEPRVAYTATQVLESVIEGGTGTRADIGRPAAGKTGTTQEYRDAWFVGYTPDLVTAVWVGYPNEQKEMTDVHGTTVTGGSFPARIWAAFMKKALEEVPETDFAKPEGDWVTVRICTETGLRATSWCPDVVKKEFLEGTEPEKYCTAHEPKEGIVPNVVGKILEKARSLLEKARFKIDVDEMFGGGAADGIVLAQDPPGGSILLQGKTVRVTVARSGSGGGAEGVPEVRGMSLSAARATLKAAGYEASESYAASGEPEGIVIDQSPGAGKPLKAGGTVHLTVSSGHGGGSTTSSTVVEPPVTGHRLSRTLSSLFN